MADDPQLETIKAFIKMQAELPQIEEKGYNPYFKSKYAPWDAIIEKIRPVLAKHGFAFFHRLEPMVDHETGQPTKDTLYVMHLVHVSGGELISSMALEEWGESKILLQRKGGGMTFLRRYMLVSLLGLSTGDDTDAEGMAKSAEAPPGAAEKGASSPAPARKRRAAPKGKAAEASQEGPGPGTPTELYDWVNERTNGYYRSIQHMSGAWQKVTGKRQNWPNRGDEPAYQAVGELLIDYAEGNAAAQPAAESGEDEPPPAP